MPTYTDNHGYRLFADGEEPWEHRGEFQQLDTDVPIVDDDTARSNYTAKANALFFARDTGVVYRGDGVSWIQIGDISDGGGGGGTGDPTATEGIASKRDHVGPFPQDTYHESPDMWGVHFAAQPNLRIESTVLDFDAANSLTNQVTIELWESQTDTTPGHPNPVAPTGVSAPLGSVTTTLTDGPQRVPLGFSTASSPVTGEYYLGVSGPDVHLRRIRNAGAGWDGWADYTSSRIDLQYSGRWNNPTTGDYSKYYYRVFDIEIGDPYTQVTSPWSHDVEEIYMRPRDPAEQFDVSPRSLWFDTSGA